jgi:autotransporter-associated beta strand protein
MNTETANTQCVVRRLVRASTIAAGLAFFGQTLPAADLIWNGGVPPDWDLIAANWLDGGVSAAFADLDEVTFTDGAAAPVVNLPIIVSPASVTVNNTAVDYVFSGPGTIGGTGPLTKNGAGSLTIATLGNSYTGINTVTAGTLFVDGSLLGGGMTSVLPGATLGGTGIIAGPVETFPGGTVQPGHGGIGTLATGAATVNGSYACELDGATCDVLAVTGDLDLTGGTLAITTLAGGATLNPYVIATYSGSRPATFATVSGLPAGYAVDYTVPGEVRLTRASCVCVPPGLALWLPFDEPTGTTAANLFAGGNPGTLFGTPAHDLGSFVTNSLAFDGTDRSVDVADYPAINPGAGSFSLDAWVRRDPASGNTTRIILDKRATDGTGYSLAVSFGNLIMTLSDGTAGTNFRDTGTIPADNQWHFVGVTVIRGSPTGGQFYVDGLPTGTFTTTGQPGSLDNTAALRVGSSSVAGNSPWMGGIDEVEVFNRDLSPTEILSIFNAGNLGKCRQPLQLTCAPDKTVECGASLTFDPPTASGAAAAISVVSTATTSMAPEVVTRTWQATDACGNTATCSQTVTRGAAAMQTVPLTQGFHYVACQVAGNPNNEIGNTGFLSGYTGSLTSTNSDILWHFDSPGGKGMQTSVIDLVIDRRARKFNSSTTVNPQGRCCRAGGRWPTPRCQTARARTGPENRC